MVYRNKSYKLYLEDYYFWENVEDKNEIFGLFHTKKEACDWAMKRNAMVKL